MCPSFGLDAPTPIHTMLVNGDLQTHLLANQLFTPTLLTMSNPDHSLPAAAQAAKGYAPQTSTSGLAPAQFYPTKAGPAGCTAPDAGMWRLPYGHPFRAERLGNIHLPNGAGTRDRRRRECGRCTGP